MREDTRRETSRRKRPMQLTWYVRSALPTWRLGEARVAQVDDLHLDFDLAEPYATFQAIIPVDPRFCASGTAFSVPLD